jgi:hypothetical protein
MVSPDVKVTAASITHKSKEGRNSLCGEQIWRPEGFNEYCSPEMAASSEAVEESNA